jgi:CubicO group peptidase (beta-lactamase class C family)
VISRILAIGLPFLLLCSSAAADQRFARISFEIQQLIDEQQLPSLAVAVAKDGRVIWTAGFGWADRERRIAATPNTTYSLASISKPFTATAVMKLVEAGRLVLDRPANDYLGEARITGRHTERATVRRVLSHTAGLPPYFQIRSGSGEPFSFAETIASRAILVQPPGRRYVYSNLGYGILDHIVERVSGLTYAEFMRRELFEPLGLERTFVPIAPPPGAAVRYDADGEPLRFYDVDHRGASAVHASAHDLVRFGMFHLDEGARDHESEGAGGSGILKPKSIREMQRVHTWITADQGYGLGWQVEADQRGFRHLGHTGGMPGVTTVLSLFPAERVVIVVLANQRNEIVVPLARRVAGIVMPSYAWRLRQARK